MRDHDVRKTRIITKPGGRRLDSHGRKTGTIVAFVVVAAVLLVCLNVLLVSCEADDNESKSPALEEIINSDRLEDRLSYLPNTSEDDSGSDSAYESEPDASGDSDSESNPSPAENSETSDANGDDAVDDVATDSDKSPSSTLVQPATVEKVIDGDTLQVNLNGNSYSVRIIGVDAPESVHPDEEKNTQEGDWASDFTKSLVSEGQTVYLQKDVSETDRYDRLLRYVWLENPGSQAYDINYVRDHMLNGILVYQGFAQAKDYPPDSTYANIFSELQADAVANGRGLSYMWSS